jgi:L-threonylcarbamoyladenylate synthase
MKVSLQKAIEILKNNNIVAIPTETVYGLAGLITSELALKNIFATKKRPFFDPLIVHVKSVEAAKNCTSYWGPVENYLATHCWPGPLTLIMPKHNSISALITADQEAVGIRCPNHPLTLKLLELLPAPLAAPSANIFKKVSPTSADHVLSEFQQSIPVLDGGECTIGLESTVLQVIYDEHQVPLKIQIFRAGYYRKNVLKNILATSPWGALPIEYAQSPVAPGQLNEHYRPAQPLDIFVLNGQEHMPLSPGEMLLTLPDEPTLAARMLYSTLRSHEHSASVKKLILYLTQDQWVSDEWYPIVEKLKKAASNITINSHQA